MQYGDFIACITESLIHHEMEEGKTYAQACNDVEDFIILLRRVNPVFFYLTTLFYNVIITL